MVGDDGEKKSVSIKGGCDLPLAEKLISSKANLAEIAEELKIDAEGRQKLLFRRCGASRRPGPPRIPHISHPIFPLYRYCSFVKSERGARPTQPSVASFFGGAATAAAPQMPKWPAWRLPKFSASLLHPTARNLRSTVVALHKQLEPWLLGDIIRRSPGKGCSSDGTFKLMLRTRTDGQVLMLLIGDDHTVSRRRSRVI